MQRQMFLEIIGWWRIIEYLECHTTEFDVYFVGKALGILFTIKWEDKQREEVRMILVVRD